MIQTETSKAKILFVRVPNDAKDFLVEKSELSYWGNFDWIDEKLPQGNWAILNTLDEVTEDEAKIILGVRESESMATHKKRLHEIAASLGIKDKIIILYELKQN